MIKSRSVSIISAFVLTLCSPHFTRAQTAIPHSVTSQFDMKKCVNIGNSLDAPTEGEWGPPIDLNYFSLIKQAGFDTVRIPVRWSADSP